MAIETELMGYVDLIDGIMMHPGPVGEVLDKVDWGWGCLEFSFLSRLLEDLLIIKN